jgi:hypothetical protein
VQVASSSESPGELNNEIFACEETRNQLQAGEQSDCSNSSDSKHPQMEQKYSIEFSGDLQLRKFHFKVTCLSFKSLPHSLR